MLEVQQIFNMIFRDSTGETPQKILELQQILNEVYDDAKNTLRVSVDNLGEAEAQVIELIEAYATLLSAADNATLSGAPKVFVVHDDEGAPYYFKAYPDRE